MNEIENQKDLSAENAIPTDERFEAQQATDQNTEEIEEKGPYMTFNYNHDKVELGQDEATEWAQKGMHYFNKLDYLAHINGTTVDGLLKDMIGDVDRQKRLELEQKFGDDSALVDDLMTLFHQQNKEKYQKAVAERAQAEQKEIPKASDRLLSEFSEIQKDFPELKSLDDIPRDVLSASNEMPLLVAYMLYRHREEQKIENAKRDSFVAASVSAGSVASNVHDSETTAHNAFMKALWR